MGIKEARQKYRKRDAANIKSQTVKKQLKDLQVKFEQEPFREVFGLPDKLTGLTHAHFLPARISQYNLRHPRKVDIVLLSDAKIKYCISSNEGKIGVVVNEPVTFEGLKVLQITVVKSLMISLRYF